MTILNKFLPSSKDELVKTLFFWPFCAYIGMDIYVKYFHNKTYPQSYKALWANVAGFFKDPIAYSAFYVSATISLIIIIAIFLFGYNYRRRIEKILQVIPVIIDIACYGLVVVFRDNFAAALLFYILSTLEAAFLYQKYMQVIFDKKNASQSGNIVICSIGLLCYGFILIGLVK